MTKPITPTEAIQRCQAMIPDFVLESVNELLVQNANKNVIRLKQDTVIELIIEKMLTLNPDALESECRTTIFDNGWLDFEELYRQAGWVVEYYKPAYNETGNASFNFSVEN